MLKLALSIYFYTTNMDYKLIPHNRKVTSDMIAKYGDFATHDIEVEAIILEENGKTLDKNGNEANIDKKFISNAEKSTNDWIIANKNNILQKLKSFWKKPINDVLSIPVIKDHKADHVDGTVGYVKGLVYAKEKSDKFILLCKILILDLEAKVKVESKLYNRLSVGIREDGSIREVSFVVNPALPSCGLLMSENKVINKTLKKNTIIQNEPITYPVDDNYLALSEELRINNAKYTKLVEKIIPNHIMLSSMIKNGQIEPYKYDNLINKDTDTINLLYTTLPQNDIFKMISLSAPALVEQTDRELNEFIKKYKKDTKEEKVVQMPQVMQNNVNLKESRDKELKHILELSKVDFALAEQYINIELGNTTNKTVDNDIYLSEYMKEAETIKEKVNTLTLQLGEYTCRI
jgi:hypothetical protein